jgi:hypothetical protein
MEPGLDDIAQLELIDQLGGPGKKLVRRYAPLPPKLAQPPDEGLAGRGFQIAGNRALLQVLGELLLQRR